jgi:hypothetical protein
MNIPAEIVQPTTFQYENILIFADVVSIQITKTPKTAVKKSQIRHSFKKKRDNCHPHHPTRKKRRFPTTQIE